MNIADERLTYMELASERGARLSSSSPLSNLLHLSLCQFSPMVPSAAWVAFGMISGWFGSAALSFHIGIVLVLGAYKQMVRPTARRVIALVADAEAFGNGAVCENPRKAMSLNLFIVHSYQAITVTVEVSGPQPASIRFFNLGPELISYWYSSLKGAIARVVAKLCLLLSAYPCIFRDKRVAAVEANSFDSGSFTLGAIAWLTAKLRGELILDSRLLRKEGYAAGVTDAWYFGLSHAVRSPVTKGVDRPVRETLTLARAACILPRINTLGGAL